MINNIQKRRCAIYTRKSVENEGGRLEFNSNDAQREAGENYIASQKSNGWVCLPTLYDDYGFSGGNMNRPALKQLMTDCEAGLIDIVVVYKIDRLSRSLTDFAELSKKFDEWGVSFVAVTQEINTATSAGRMMLNILMTFAQYEREIITERVRDKMAASRKKGKWVGGSVPFGYKVIDKKLIIEPSEAEIIKRVFQRFIEVQSPKIIASELNQNNILTRSGKIWNKDYIYRILNNHTYIGEVNYKGEICKGEQEAILDIAIWNRTREILKANDPIKDRQKNIENIAPLKGLLFCGHCNGAMTPTYSKKNNKKYTYYACSKDSKRAISTCPIKQITAGDIEKAIKEQLRNILSTDEFLTMLSNMANIDADDIFDMLDTDFWEEITPGEFNRLVSLLLEKATVRENSLTLEFKIQGLQNLLEELNYDKL